MTSFLAKINFANDVFCDDVIILKPKFKYCVIVFPHADFESSTQWRSEGIPCTLWQKIFFMSPSTKLQFEVKNRRKSEKEAKAEQ